MNPFPTVGIIALNPFPMNLFHANDAVLVVFVVFIAA